MDQLNASACVAVLTTTGVVFVQRIEPDNAARRSVMCINRSATEAGVSRAYNRFVDYQTGVVSRMTGAHAYRTDVDSDITDGESWQLPIFLAHHLRHDDRFIAPLDSATNSVIWMATGRVDADLNVLPVDGLNQKLDALEAWLGSHGDAYEAVFLSFSEDNKLEIDARLMRLMQRHENVVVRYLKKTAEAFQDTSFKPVLKQKAFAGFSAAPISMLAIGGVMFLAGALVLGAMRMSAGGVPQDEDTARKAEADSIELTSDIAHGAGIDILLSGARSGAGGCFQTRIPYGPVAVSVGESVELDAENGWCSLRVKAVGVAGASLTPVIAMQDGVSMPPTGLGPNGEVFSVLRRDYVGDVRIGFNAASDGPLGDRPWIELRIR